LVGSGVSTNTSLPKRRGRQQVVEIDVEEEDEGYEEPPNGVVDLTAEDVFAERKITISASCMQGYKSALLWWYKEKKIIIDKDIDSHLNQLIKGYEVVIAKKKATGVMNISEGKSALSFSGYIEICKIMMKMQPQGNRNPFTKGIFGWSYMIFMWNLMARAASVGNIMLQHVDWREDSLLVTFARHKGDQTGEGLGNEKHVYANPMNPQVCPILALAVLIFTKHRNGGALLSQLFEGNGSEKRFTKILQYSHRKIIY